MGGEVKSTESDTKEEDSTKAGSEKTEKSDVPVAHSYVVDNSKLKSTAGGLGYRLSRRVDDVHPEKTALWGEHLQGFDSGDGWLAVCRQHHEDAKALYLPFKVRGIDVLRFKKEGEPEPTYPGFVLGSWDYMAVGKGPSVYGDPMAPNALRVTHLNAGEYCKMSERGALIQGGMWLRLADGRGWVSERQHTLVMSEVEFEALDDHLRGESLVLDPRLTKSINVYNNPTDAEKMKLGELHAGQPIHAKGQARMLMLMADGASEMWRVFYAIDYEGKQGWVMQTPEMQVVAFQHSGFGGGGFGLGGGYSSATGSDWLYIEDKQLPIYKYPGHSAPTPDSVHQDDFIEATERQEAGGMIFHRLKSGGWIEEKKTAKGKKALEVLKREPHHFIYMVAEKEGIDTKEKPTREKVKHLHHIKNKVRVVTKESVKYDDGDMFVYVEAPYGGWVGLTTKGSKKGPRLECLGPSDAGGPAVGAMHSMGPQVCGMQSMGQPVCGMQSMGQPVYGMQSGGMGQPAYGMGQPAYGMQSGMGMPVGAMQSMPCMAGGGGYGGGGYGGGMPMQVMQQPSVPMYSQQPMMQQGPMMVGQQPSMPMCGLGGGMVRGAW